MNRRNEYQRKLRRKGHTARCTGPVSVVYSSVNCCVPEGQRNGDQRHLVWLGKDFSLRVTRFGYAVAGVGCRSISVQRLTPGYRRAILKAAIRSVRCGGIVPVCTLPTAPSRVTVLTVTLSGVYCSDLAGCCLRHATRSIAYSFVNLLCQKAKRKTKQW